MSTNTVIHRIVRPAVRAVAPSGVTPNQVTTVRVITGIAAAVAFAGPGSWPAIGGAIFLLSMLLDRADGELARQTGQSSAAGHRYDLISDCTSNMIAFIGLGLGSGAPAGLLWPLLGLVAGVGIGTLFWQLNVIRIASVRTFVLSPGINIDPDDLLVFVPVLVWLGATAPMLVAAAIITPLAALWIGISGARQARASQGR
ncbi:CDP-alcohol phosphatidyltransferase family protein [Muricoccus aerilatus]|uniref:CDP-alcohol phosphatidyltransferase family protein n=1 Tax=Muricoccus aerilatus TaxID=452982 RepID=UPI0005C1FEEB|nr:CDP-alcohol phosphatidyltransferase family protein [Roseomonas aerilata]